jgi:hypothetical protein
LRFRGAGPRDVGAQKGPHEHAALGAGSEIRQCDPELAVEAFEQATAR